MAAPSRYNRRLKARNDRRKRAASGGGRTPSEAGLGRSMRASGRAVSRTNRQVAPRATRTRSERTLQRNLRINRKRAKVNPLATKPVKDAIERLRTEYGSSGRTKSQESLGENMELSGRRDQAERKLENTVLRSLPTRGESLKAEREVRQTTRLNAEGTRVEKLAGAKQVGTQPVQDVQRAAERGQLRRKGKRFTTPEVRQVKRKAKRVQKKIARLKRKVGTGGMPEGVPPEYAKWIRKFSPRIDKQARATYGLSGNEFMAKMLQGESGFDMSKVGPNTPYGNARGAAQFIPPTRDSFVEKFGIDPWRSTKEAVQAMAIHLDGKSYSKTFGIQGYNPGINDSYYLNQDVGRTKPGNPRARQKLEAVQERGLGIARQAAKLGLSVQGIATPKQLKAAGVEMRNKPKRPTLWAQPKKSKGKGIVTWINGTTPDGINPDVIAYAKTISRMTGINIEITSALRPHSAGSNHQLGGALDINAIADGGASERRGDAIAYASVIAAGGSKADAQALASGAVPIVEFDSPNGHRVELLWKGDPGHRDHVHIAIESGQSRGKKVFRGRKAIGQGALSGAPDAFTGPTSGGTSGGGATTTGTTTGEATPDSPRERARQRRETALDRLAELGFRVTPSGIKRTGVAGGPAPSTRSSSKQGEALTTLKRKYKVK